MRLSFTFAFATIVVVTGCSDDGVPLDDGTSSAQGDTDAGESDTLPSTITVDSTDSNPSTDPSGTSDDPTSSSGDATTVDPTDSGEDTSTGPAGSSSTETSSSSDPTDPTSSGDPTDSSPSSSSEEAGSESTDSGGALCGDGIVEGEETCDGDDLGDAETCADLGWNAGALACNPGSCQYDESACNDEPAFTIEFCRLQFPTASIGDAGDVLDVFGRVYVSGLTDQSQGNDVAANVAMQVGYGNDGSDASFDPSWVWFAAGPNVGYGPASPSYEMNNDEYTGAMILPPAGEYDFAVRFTGDGEAAWTVCDGGDPGSSNGYAPADAGQLTTQ